MNAIEVMMECPITLDPTDTIAKALSQASQSTLDLLPVVDKSGKYYGTVAKNTLAENSDTQTRKVSSLCCDDALICEPHFALEELDHDAMSSTPHRTIVVVDQNGKFQGIVPYVNWAVDEAKVQSGHPRSPLEVRTYSMHLIWKCLECGHAYTREDGIPDICPHCQGHEFALYTED